MCMHSYTIPKKITLNIWSDFMKIEVLVTTMHQRDYTKYYDMNLKTDAVIANQADRNETLETVIDGNHVKLVTTDMRGLSKNRNIALENSVDEDTVVIMKSDDSPFDIIDELQ